MYEEFGISKKLEALANKCEDKLNTIFEEINKNSLCNSKKVLMAFQKNEVSDMHFGTTTGYGEGDVRKRYNRKDICRGFTEEKIALLEINLYQERMHLLFHYLDF